MLAGASTDLAMHQAVAVGLTLDHGIGRTSSYDRAREVQCLGLAVLRQLLQQDHDNRMCLPSAVIIALTFTVRVLQSPALPTLIPFLLVTKLLLRLLNTPFYFKLN